MALQNRVFSQDGQILWLWFFLAQCITFRMETTAQRKNSMQCALYNNIESCPSGKKNGKTDQGADRKTVKPTS